MRIRCAWKKMSCLISLFLVQKYFRNNTWDCTPRHFPRENLLVLDGTIFRSWLTNRTSSHGENSQILRRCIGQEKRGKLCLSPTFSPSPNNFCGHHVCVDVRVEKLRLRPRVRPRNCLPNLPIEKAREEQLHWVGWRGEFAEARYRLYILVWWTTWRTGDLELARIAWVGWCKFKHPVIWQELVHLCLPTKSEVYLLTNLRLSRRVEILFICLRRSLDECQLCVCVCVCLVMGGYCGPVRRSVVSLLF